jgi:trk system potassium uptake protein TrkH
MTTLLVLSGTLFFLLAEFTNMASGALGALPEGQKPLAALFQSVTCRTAGFNSIDQASLSDSSKLVSIFLMFIGAAPGSTAGGIKVSTLAVILATVFSDMRGQEDIVLMRHRLSRETFTRAIAILGLAVSVVALASLALSFIENRTLRQLGGFEFIDLAFEATSAFGTVGLTSAGTAGLQPASWAVLIPAMFLGRVGPASFAISLMMARQHKRDMVYPEGKTLVG